MPNVRRISRGFEKWLDDLATRLDAPPSTVRAERRRPTDPLDPEMEALFDEAASKIGHVPPGTDPDSAQIIREMLQSGKELARSEQVLGMMTPLRIGGAATGGALGAASGDDPAERWKRGLLGAVAGGVVLPGAAQATMLGTTGADRLSNYLFYSYLSSPDTIARANFGAIGGVINHALEQGIVGMMGGAGAGKARRDAIETLKAIPESMRIFKHTLTAPEKDVRYIRQSIFGKNLGEAKGGTFGGPGTGLWEGPGTQRFRDVGLGRWFSAGDNAAVYALKRGGMNVDDAMRYTLAGQPESDWGQGAVNMVRKGLHSPSLVTRGLTGALAPFARVGVVGLEQGAKRIPFVGGTKLVGGTAPTQLKRARQAVGGGLGTAGYFAEGDPDNTRLGIDPRITQTLGTVAGPAFLPFQMGRELRRAGKTEENIGRQLQTAAGQSFLEFSPLGFQPLAFLQRPLAETARRMLPSGLADVAEAMDPAFGRDLTPDALQEAMRFGELPPGMDTPGIAQLLSAIPGGREQLPERFAPVTWRGERRLPESIAFPGQEQLANVGGMPGAALQGLGGMVQKSLFPSRANAIPPVADLDDPLVRAFPDVQLHSMLPPFKLSQQQAGEVQQRRGLGNVLSAQVMQQYLPLLQNLPPHQQQAWARYLFNAIKRPMQPIMQAANIATATAGQAPFRGV